MIYATWHHAAESVPDASSADVVVGRLQTAVERLGDVCAHLSDRYHQFTVDPALRHDRLGERFESMTEQQLRTAAGSAAYMAVTDLGGASRQLHSAAQKLDAAHQQISHLYQDLDEDEDEVAEEAAVEAGGEVQAPGLEAGAGPAADTAGDGGVERRDRGRRR